MAQIRAAVTDDLDKIAACARAAYALYVPRIGREPAPMVADFAAQIAAGRVWVLIDDGRIGGFVVHYRRDDHLHLENVAVHPDRQGRGFGRMLIAHAETVARQSGAVAVELYTNARMTENQALYPALGYEEIARRQEDGFDRVFYRKRM